MKLNIRCTNGTKFDVNFEEHNESTVKDLKKAIEAQKEIPAEEQRLIYAGRIMKDFNTVASYNVKEGAAVHLVRGVAKKRQNTNTSQQQPQQHQQQQQQPPLSSFFNNRQQQQQQQQPTTNGNNNNSTGFNIPNSFAQRNPNNNVMGMDPEQMRAAMQNPFMQQLMANPEFMRNIMMNNPATRRMIQDHPELEQILTSPETMRQFSEIAADPDRLQDMMRSFDLQLNQIESMPGGYSLLQRYLGGHQDEGFDTPSNQETPQDHNQSNTTNEGPVNTSSLPNPWANRPRQNNTSQQQQQNNNNNNNQTNPFANMFGGGGNNPMMGNGGGFPNMFNGNGGMNMNDSMQMMQNPMMRQMMDNMLSNPDMLRQMTQNNPMFANNPMMQQLVDNPDMMRQMMNMMYGPAPNQQQNQQQQQQQNPQQNQQQQPNMMNMMNMFQNMQGQFPQHTPQQPQAMPSLDELRQRYGPKLEQLRAMGFYDDEKSAQALHRTNGNVSAAVDYLLNNP